MTIDFFKDQLNQIIAKHTLEDAYALFELMFTELGIQEYTLDYSETAPSLNVVVELPGEEAIRIAA